LFKVEVLMLLLNVERDSVGMFVLKIVIFEGKSGI